MKTFGFFDPQINYKKRAAVYGVFFRNNKDQVAIIRNEKNDFFLPGGGMEGNETFEQCLKREVVEETGFSMEIVKFIGQAQYYFYSENEQMHYHNIGHFYLCEFQNQLCLPTESNHFLEWVSPLQAKQHLVFDHHVWAIQQVLLT